MYLQTQEGYIYVNLFCVFILFLLYLWEFHSRLETEGGWGIRDGGQKGTRKEKGRKEVGGWLKTHMGGLITTCMTDAAGVVPADFSSSAAPAWTEGRVSSRWSAPRRRCLFWGSISLPVRIPERGAVSALIKLCDSAQRLGPMFTTGGVTFIYVAENMNLLDSAANGGPGGGGFTSSPETTNSSFLKTERFFSNQTNRI